MGFLDRIANIFSASANDAVDKLEDPASITRQGIRDLKVELEKAVDAEAQLKSLTLGQRADAEKEKQAVSHSLDQATRLKGLINGGDTSPELREGLKAALQDQAKHNEAATHLTEQADAKQKTLDGIVAHIQELKTTIEGYESDLTELESQNTAAEVAIKVETSLNADKVGSIKNSIDRVKAKTTSNQHLAEAWDQIANDNKSASEKVDDILKKKSASNADADMEAFLKS